MHILITGASSGIGEELARYYAKKGYKITLAARRKQKLEELASELDTEVFIRPSDLSDLDQCQPLIDEAVNTLGTIDILINNAGIQYVEPTISVTPERGERLMTVDLLAPMRLIYGVLPSMTQRKQGTIINVASMAGLIFTPGMCHYNAAKAGLGAASESLRVELENTGVHVLTVYPGPVTTPMEQKARESFEESATVKYIPTGNPQELAKLIDKALIRKNARVIYPSVYGLSRYFRVISQWMTDKFTPSVQS